MIPELEKSLGEGNGSLIQYSCLRNTLDRGAWRATVHGVTKQLDTIEQLTVSDTLTHILHVHIGSHLTLERAF